MRLFSGKKIKKTNKVSKLDDYVGYKVNNIKKIINENKTLIICSLIGSVYYVIKKKYL